MKPLQKFTTLAVLVGTMTLLPTRVGADSAASVPASEAAPAATSSHLKLCAMLGLEVGRTYVFWFANDVGGSNWTIRSLGAKGWIQVKDFNFGSRWVNLSQVTSVAPSVLTKPEERAKKPNRDR